MVIGTNCVFLSTLSLRRATTGNASGIHTHWISIHALLAESDRAAMPVSVPPFRFLSTLSLRRATIYCHLLHLLFQFLSTLSLRRATWRIPQNQLSADGISIHALLAESDVPPFRKSPSVGDFYPRSPCGERPPRPSRVVPTPIFLSTLSLRRATQSRADRPRASRYFYPRSPCGERPHSAGPWQAKYTISIHALLAESDNWPRVMVSPTLYFYPRSPCGERRQGPPHHRHSLQISIHALLAESDHCPVLQTSAPVISIHALLAESDLGILGRRLRYRISIHALLAESDKLIARQSGPLHDFYPRSPCGERLTYYVI